MAKQSNTRKCRYTHCLHKDTNIDIETDEYVKDKNAYYHKDCFQAKCDIQLIRTLWHDHIDSLVVYSQLNNILNRLIFQDKVSSDYVVFAVQYCINNPNTIKLRYPPGLKYVLGNQRVKDAYKKKITKTVLNATFTATPSNDTEPKFSIPKKPSGFSSILGGK